MVLKIVLFVLPLIAIVFNIIETIYGSVFNRPIFVNFYLVVKKLPKKKCLFLKNNISFYKKLSNSRKKYFEHRVVCFIRNYNFEGRGIDVSAEMKLLIASSYVKLTFGMRHFITNTFNTIIVYPKAYQSNITNKYHKGEFNPRLKLIVFSWEDFLLGEIIINDNLNLGIHEFGHAITFHGQKSSDISANLFYKGYSEIKNILKDKEEFRKLKESNFFRGYAFSNQVEFVAVILEHFFESPKELQQQFPVLFSKIVKMLNYKSILN